MPAKTPEILDAAVIATRKRGRPAREPEALTYSCKVCGVPTSREALGLCAAHAHVALEAEADKKLVRDYLGRHAFRAAELVVQGAEIAAKRGETRPAEWLLIHTKTIEPVKTTHEGGGGVVVNIGMILPGSGQ